MIDDAKVLKKLLPEGLLKGEKTRSEKFEGDDFSLAGLHRFLQFLLTW